MIIQAVLQNLNIDVFKSFLVENASYDGGLEIPILKETFEIPDELVLFSRIKNNFINNKWICFKEGDFNIERGL